LPSSAIWAPRRRRRRLLRAVWASAAATAVALGILALLPGGGSSVVGRAAAALEAHDETILHVQMRGEQHNPDGSVVTWTDESWQLGVAPYTHRQIEAGSDGIRAESLVRGDVNELYDAQRNTIYVATQKELAALHPMPKIKIVSAARLRKIAPNTDATAALVYKVSNGSNYSVIATREGVKRLREQMAAERKHSAAGAAEDPFRAEILALLKSGRARETGRVEVDGRDAIRIESPNGKQVYLVDAATYAPIQWTSTGDGGSVTLSFPVYEDLPVDSESMKTLDLEAQYPGAQVVHGAAAYKATQARLYPHG
jgi:hypothetical protein